MTSGPTFIGMDFSTTGKSDYSVFAYMENGRVKITYFTRKDLALDEIRLQPFFGDVNLYLSTTC